jgi:hypothetical protein
MSENEELYRLLSIPEAQEKFKISRKELNLCFQRGLKFQRVGTRKKVCLRWWIDYLESDSKNRQLHSSVRTKKRGHFKMDSKTKQSIYSI